MISRYKIFLLLAFSILLSACSSINFKQKKLHSTPLESSAEFVLQTSMNRWLHYGEATPLAISNENSVIKSFEFSSEYVDYKQQDTQTVVFALSTNNQPLLISGETLKSAPAIDMVVEGLCLYQPMNDPLQVFLLDENAIAHQYLIQQNNNGIHLKLLRTFSLPPGSENCAVHDKTNRLFVNEEHIGVWEYNARAESEVIRHPVDLVSPYGRIQNNAGPLTIAGDALYVAEYGSHLVHEFAIDDKRVVSRQLWRLDPHIQLDSLMANYLGGESVHFIALNEATDTLIQWRRPVYLSTSQPKNRINVAPLAQTTPVKTQGDAADDPAIWVHPSEPEKSLILGTNKKRGLYIYDLQGHEKQELLVDRVNNVDVRQGFTLKGKQADIAAASQRDRQSIALFHIHPATGEVSIANEIKTGLDDVYGLCMYKGKHNQVYVYINDEDGRFEQWHIKDSQTGWHGERVRTFAVDSQPEGCATDEQAHRLFVGEENVALWTLGAEPNDSIDRVMVSKAGDILTADIEGMEVYASEKETLLVVSSQGSDSYVIFDAKPPFKVLGEFRVGLNGELGIDGASETDGLTVTSTPLGPLYPEGLFVVQDGRNFLPAQNQNFKLVSWQDIRIALGL